MKDGDSVQRHIREMTEIFNALSAMDTPMSEEDRVICLLASQPDSFNVLITTLEASVEVPRMAVVTERLLHEERKQKGREEDSEVKALMSRKQPKKKGPCYQCGKYGHLKWECSESSGDQREWRRGDHKAHKAGTVTDDSSDSDAFVVGHEAFSVGMKCGYCGLWRNLPYVQLYVTVCRVSIFEEA